MCHAHFWIAAHVFHSNRRLVVATSTRVLLLASLTQLYICCGVTLAYEPFFTGSRADVIDAGVLTNPLTGTSRIVQLIVGLSH